MKTEILATLQTLIQQISALPDDPTAQPEPLSIPSGIKVVNFYGTNPLCLGMSWDEIVGTPILEYRGTEDNPPGPQEWTPTPVSSYPAIGGEWATLVMQNPQGQKVTFRLSYSYNGQTSDYTYLEVHADDYLTP